mmetsp:Transcript_17942/g.24820  ORF Transcript_17942/g.24820 Transcript_17942/m.24820 type:complete len:426 (-) Transcript_17942:304-1581(-)|eukprot:CAMPEP_0196584486 /NCGR_PEP_ID=MMETSP1081-20130531/47189_1 /TAXON_ID=36882 /ORGANISM="Pyramimonas amylifera, Strain CCMP720" /LENGTH=425 /DNA_ID=CAMNT_0041905699 /DNA_START=157 /DNA_END=1434 /DNA_ORIENTATION=+
MSVKEQKPTLGGARIRTRKRNISVPLDKGSFADTVVTIFNDSHEEGLSVAEQLDSFVKTLEASELDFSRYGDTLYEVLFTGGRLGIGAGAAEEGEQTMDYHVLAVPCTKEAIQPFLSCFSVILRRRPFLIKNLENILKRLLQQLEHYNEQQRDTLAYATALVFTRKLGIPPENLMLVLVNDVLIAKGTMLRFVTHFFKAYLSENSMEDLLNLLKKSKIDDIVQFFPMQKRTQEAFKAHFTAAELPVLVSYQEKKLAAEGFEELEHQLINHIEEYPNGVAEGVDIVKAAKASHILPDSELIKLLFKSIIGSIALNGKNQQQISNAALRQVKVWGALLAAFTTTPRLQIELINTIQDHCYAVQELMKVFPNITRLLYDADVISEEAILFWAKKGSNSKGRQLFLDSMAPFIKWLEEAEEEEEDEDEE